MKLWGGRYKGSSNPRMRSFCDSIAFDQRLKTADVKGSIAYANALQRAGCISVGERDLLVSGLQRILREFEEDEFSFFEQEEDIHTAVERRLTELVGEVAGKLHTGRSRNDQVSTDLRLYLLSEITALDSAVAELQTAIVAKAQQHLDVIMPGYTHMQQAQPVLFSHWLMSFFWKLQRDRARLTETRKRIAIMPLGSGAIAGHPFGVNREELAAELGFEAVTENSIDAVSDRDFVVEFLAWAALLQVHLSGLAEDLIVWSSREFGFLTVDETFTTGSSLMPHKRNPDALELMRAKTGRMAGHLVGMLTVLKGMPSGYGKDLQEDKEALFDAVDTLAQELPLAAEIVLTLQINKDRIVAALDEAMLSTDLADYLVRKGVPFRESHRLVGVAVKRAEELGIALSELEWPEYVAVDARFGEDLYEVFDFETSINKRMTVGGTALGAVEAQIARAQALLDAGLAQGE